jgi:hypothetical protein
MNIAKQPAYNFVDFSVIALNDRLFKIATISRVSNYFTNSPTSMKVLKGIQKAHCSLLGFLNPTRIHALR